MERILSSEQMRSADKFNIENLGISEETLIYRAGSAVAEEVNRRLKGGRVLVCVGKGNNGKDGEVAAKILSNIHGFTVATLNVYNGIFKMFDKKFDIIVDCIFGTGLDREITGRYKEAIERINSSGAYVVSCDIPSGLNANTGKVMGAAVKADLTIAIQEYKLGHFLNDGKDYCGKIILKDIGLSVWDNDFALRLEKSDVAKFFPERKHNVNKGDFGKSAIIGGSKKYSGSSLLSMNALSAYKVGTGYSFLFVPECVFGSVVGLYPETIVSSIKDDSNNFIFDKETLDNAMKNDAIAFGMGSGVTEEVYKSLKYLLENYTGNLIIDADGINSLAKFGKEILKNKKCKVVLTPHVKEFSRLCEKDVPTITENSNIAIDFAREFKVVIALKSNTTIITDGEKVILNTTGSPCMAKAGSGDVLSGLICGILSRSDDVFMGVSSACYLFGLAGEIAEKEQNSYSVTASDIIYCIPKAINSL